MVTELDFGPPVEAWAPQLGVWSAADTALFGVKSFSCWMIGYT